MRRLVGAAAVCLSVAILAVGVSGARTTATAQPATAQPARAQDTVSGSGSFTTTKTVTRDNLINGVDTPVESKSVTLNVNETTNLQGRQEIDVSWSGAHPTGGIVADQNSAAAQDEEYPFVLLECRGVDSTTADPAPADQLSPETCWTQTWSEHYQDSLDDPYPPYRLDRDATAAQTQAIAGAPSPLPTTCQYDESAPVQDWIPFVAANGTVFNGGNAGCAGEPPESDDVGGSSLPSNETFGVTDADGTGSADFDVWTSAENASLGCSQTVACSLVAIPIMGISCDITATTPAPDASACEDTGAFTPGQLMPSAGGNELAVSGSLWWSPSNWQNRISVPLSFATPASACSVVSSPTQNIIDIYGSELMIQATGQWEPNFCLDPKSNFSFVHVQTGEPEARNLVATGGAEAAFTSFGQTGGYGKPVVNAPVAVTGFSISYAIDGTDGQPYTSLKITPLLLAKLLTQSYPADLPIQEADTALSKNPLNITDDPEFIALNPGIPQGVGASEAASELIAMSSDSDVMEALTTYINDDPTARAWLNGKPDTTDGEDMVVNPAYQGIQLPVDQWPQLSTFEPTAWYASDNNDCLFNDPVPFFPLIAAPLANLEDISKSLQYDLPNSTTVCSQPSAGSSEGEKLVTNGRQSVGNRFMIGITPLADNQRYQLQSAALQTTSGTFVAPSSTSLEAATSLVQPDSTSGTWPIPYSEFEQSAGATAYPGTMLVYAAIPTSGLPATDAQDYASFLKFAAGSGQTQGFGVGQLPPGYLPLTSADGLGGLADYTVAAAADVAAQNGQVPSLTAVSSSASTSPSAGSKASTTAYPPVGPHPSASSGQSNGGSGSGSGSGSGPGSGSGGASSHAGKKATGLPLTRSVANILRLGSALAIALWTGGILILLILGLGLLGALSIPLTYLVGRQRGKW
jgi:hypothetical protein